MSFYETRFPESISYGSQGGPGFKTDVVVMDSGKEQRNQRWSKFKNFYDAAFGVETQSDLIALRDFFVEMRGMAHEFRYKDWFDYSVTDEALVPDGSPTTQLIKTYGSGFNDYAKTISKPVTGVTLERNAASYTTFTLDTTTGIVTHTALLSVNILAITQANPPYITTDGAHGISDGDYIYLDGIVGMTELNGNVYHVNESATNEFYLIGIDATGYTAYTSDGTAEKYVQPADALTWTGEFDVPCRFSSDQLSITLTDYQHGSTSVPIEEVKL